MAYMPLDHATPGKLSLTFIGVDCFGPFIVPRGRSDLEECSKKGTAEAIIDDIKDLDWVVDRVSFMKAAIHHMEQQLKESAVQGGGFTSSQGKHPYVKFRWEGEDLLTDNTNICQCDLNTPTININTKLVLKMGKLCKVNSRWILGPNLEQEFMVDQRCENPERLEQFELRRWQPRVSDSF